MKTKIITFWSPVKRQGGCSTNVALYASYLSNVMDETEKAVIYSLNENADVADYLTSSTIRNGGKDLLLLSETNNVNYKEDILAYTHKLSENLDILGTGKERDLIAKRIIKMTEILTIAYDYILIDSVTDDNPASHRLIEISDLIVVCVPQDKFVYEELDMTIFENKKVIFLSSVHSEKNELSINKIQAMVPVQVYKISREDKVNQAVYEQEVFGYISNEIKRKSTIINELSELHNEIFRLINLDRLNITYEIKNNYDKKNNEISPRVITEPEIKIIKEYKFIKAKNNIAVINLSQGAGSTFMSLNLAYILKDKKVDASLIEIPSDNMKADISNIICEDFESSSKTIIKNGIRFYVNNSEKMRDWSQKDIIEYISSISKENNMNIYDIGSQVLNENIHFLFNVIDVAIIVIDPMPYQLLQAEERIKAIKNLEEKNLNVIYIINKYIKDLSKKDIEKYLQVKISSCIPFINPEILYAAYYSNQTVYQFEKSELFLSSLQKILFDANILEEYETKNDNKKFRLFRWR